ncbi:MAG: phage tail protein [Desulfobacteraceae bacterium]|nr:phage tail protein [Desulfobacteraceae bacterium]
MPQNNRQDPYLNSRFVVEIDGIADSGFSRVVLPESRLDLIEYREGTDPRVNRKLYGRPSFTTLILERGTGSSQVLSDWFRQAKDGGPGARKNIRIVLQDDTGINVCIWQISGAIPTRYAFASLDATSGAVLLETLEIACENVERAHL